MQTQTNGKAVIAMAKTAEIKILLSPEKKELWKQYCEAHQCGLTLSRLIEHAVDDKVCGKTEFIDKNIGEGAYWVVKPNGAYRKQYDIEVLSKGRKEIERLDKRNKERAEELEGYLW